MINVQTAKKTEIKAFLLSQGLYMPSNMLSVSADSKTVKGEKLGFLTGIVYLIPDNVICPASLLAECQKACLVSAGRGKFNSVIRGRMNKTAIYKKFPHIFYELISRDIKRLANKAKRESLDYCVRLNGTSDIDHTAFIAEHSDTQFYDYTKRSNLVKKNTLENYHLTFSYSGVTGSYIKHVEIAKNFGANLAVVFSDSNIPKTFLGLPVISGDDSDLRFLDYKVLDQQAIIGLYAKGDAKKDTSGFVVQTNTNTNIIARG